ncbi:hypothetical protein BC829DRAFT_75892 [Chytridium lagenaria]|nr:hypothetical protein BC829DRAFT_75892 [Chytridium lagenaria]
MSDVLCDIYASIRNYMIMNEAEKAVGGILFFGIYKNWNLSRSLLVLLINLTVGVITAFNRLDRSVYIMASAFQFIVSDAPIFHIFFPTTYVAGGSLR